MIQLPVSVGITKIKRLEKADLAEIISLYRHLHHTDDVVDSQQLISETWDRICARPDIAYFGLYFEDRLVSSCHIVVVPNLTRGCRSYATIENVVTHVDYRNRGFATTLLKHVIEFAWCQKCYKVMLMTGSKKEWIYRFYERAGFQRGVKTAFIAKQ